MYRSIISEIKRRGVVPIVSSYAILGWIIIQIVTVFAAGLAIPQWLITLVSVLIIAGFPIAFYVAWFFEFTANGVKRTPNKNESEVSPLGTWHWIGLLSITVIAANVSYFAYNNSMDSFEKADENITQLVQNSSLGVMPFVDMSADQDQSYLAKGIPRELISLLGTFDNLMVSSSASSFRLAELYSDPVIIGQELNVSSLLTGSVRNQGDLLKINVELISTETGKVLWSKNISRKLIDIFAIEEEIARAIVNLVQDAYIKEGEVSSLAKTASSDAFVLYLKGQQQVANRTTESITEARKLFEQSLGLDPEFALAQIGLAKTVLLLSDVDESYGTLDLDVATVLANRNLEKAIIRNPDLAEAQALFGRSYGLNGQHELAISFYEKAALLNPNLVEAHFWKQIALRKLLRFDEANDALQKAFELDPASAVVLFAVALEANRQREFDKAQQYFEDLIRLYPDTVLGYRGLADLHARNGNLSGAASAWMAALEQSPDSAQYREAVIGILLQVGAVDIAKTYIKSDDWKVNIFIASKDYTSALETIGFSVRAYPNEPWVLFEASWYEFLYGDDIKAMGFMQQAEGFFSETDLYNEPLCMPAMEIAYVNQVSNNVERAQSIFSKCEKMLSDAREASRKQSDYDYLEARLAAVNGDTVVANKALQRAYDKGWREAWSEFDPLLEGIKNEPDAKRVFDNIQTSLTEARITIEENFAN